MKQLLSTSLTIVVLGSAVLAYSQDVERGIDLYHAKKYAEAEQALAQAVQANNEDARAHEHLGLARLSLGKPDEAYAELSRAEDLAPDSDSVKVGLARVLIEKKDFALADREKGKFRFYLLGALKHFLADQHDKATALKRGGGQTFISFDAQTAEQRYHLEPVDEATPDKLFERRWALTLLDQALARLRQECAAPGKAQLYEALETFLTGAPNDSSYAEIAARLGTTESAIKSALHRLRQRHRELIREEVAATVSTAPEVEEELRHLIAVLARQTS